MSNNLFHCEKYTKHLHWGNCISSCFMLHGDRWFYWGINNCIRELRNCMHVWLFHACISKACMTEFEWRLPAISKFKMFRNSTALSSPHPSPPRFTHWNIQVFIMSSHGTRNPPDSNYLSTIQYHSIHLCYEDGGHCFVKGSPIHVNRGANRQDKSCHAFINAQVFFKAAEGNR